MSDDGIPPVVNLREAAAALGVSQQTMRRWADNGTIPTIQQAPRTLRFVTRATLEEIESTGWPVSWHTLVELVLE